MAIPQKRSYVVGSLAVALLIAAGAARWVVPAVVSSLGGERSQAQAPTAMVQILLLIGAGLALLLIRGHEQPGNVRTAPIPAHIQEPAFAPKGMENPLLKPLDSPRLNACQEFGKLAARLHATKVLGGLDITNLTFEADGTLKHMFSIGRGRVLEEALITEQRAGDLAIVKQQLSEQKEWEAFKLGYRFGAPEVAEAVLARVDAGSSTSTSVSE